MPAAFTDHVVLLRAYLDRRPLIVEAIERQLLNVQDKETSRGRDRGRLERLLTGVFHQASGLPHMSGAHATLAAAHVEDGFEPAGRGTHSHRLDPVDLVARAYDHWDSTRWPGRNGRIAFAQVVYAAFMLGLLEHLSLRIWDSGLDDAEGNLREVQRLLDRLNADSSGPVFIRDARWLIQTAQGPLTRELAPYFRTGARIAHSFDAGYRLEVHKAGTVLTGGHLRSQQRYRASESGRAFDDPEVLAITRNSNSMDVALLAGDLVPLLERFETSLGEDDADLRRGLADIILQGLSADPELLITRLDLLGPATMVEEVFVDAAAPDGPGYTAHGERHVALIGRYRDLLTRLATALSAECLDLDPAARAYSPLGISYGFCADVLWNVALGALTSRSSSSLSLEDLFESRTRLDEKIARAHAWEQLPTRAGEHDHFSHSPEWAQQVFADVVDRLRRVGAGDAGEPTGRLIVSLHTIDAGHATMPDSAVNAQEHLVTSDVQRALSTGATAFPRGHLLADRQEGRYLASVEEDGKWFAVSKVVLTACLAQGRDAVISGVPPSLVELLRLTCPEIVV
jgi:hypothetical protein